MKLLRVFFFFTGILFGISGCIGVTETGSGNESSSNGLTADGETVYSVSSGYGRLVTLCYALPETATDTVSANRSFQITADRQTVSRGSVSDRERTETIRAVETVVTDSPAEKFHAALRETEQMLCGQAAIAPRSIVPQTAAANASLTVGERRSFYVSVNDVFKTITAECVAVTGETAFWSEVGGTALTEEQLLYLTTQFEEKIPTVRQKFGRESDVDGNSRIFVLTAALDEGIFGYFYSIDKYLQSELDTMDLGWGYRSNEADIFYVNSDFFTDFETYKVDLAATLVHEMQHMVHFDQRRQQNSSPVNSWLNEGLSMLCEYYCGYTEPHADYIAEAVRSAGISLIDSPETGAYYGYSLLFLRYLCERFGDSIVEGIYKSSYRSVGAVEEATGTDFNVLFSEFCEMILKTGRGVTTDGRFEIAAFNFREGSDGYAQNGFCLPSILDAEAVRVDLRSYNQLIFKKMNSYAFIPVSWFGGTVSSFRFSSTGVELLIGAFSE